MRPCPDDAVRALYGKHPGARPSRDRGAGARSGRGCRDRAPAGRTSIRLDAYTVIAFLQGDPAGRPAG
jgi:hypothetical protein